MSRRKQHWRWLCAGGAIALALHAFAGRWQETTFAQGGNTTFTTSTTSSTSFESPPACGVIGSSREEQTFVVTSTIGPACIGIGNRDIPNPSPACGGALPAGPPVDPFHGTPFLVAAGTQNFTTNVHTETITCVAAVPVMPDAAFAGFALAVLGLAAWTVAWHRRRRQPL